VDPLWSNASATGSTVASHPNSSDPLKCGCFSNTPTTTGCASKCESGDGYDYGHWLAKDATAWGYIDIIGVHEYDTQKSGAVMVEVTGNANADLLLSAFTGTDGTIVVGINKGTKDVSVPIAITGGTAPATCTPNVTSANDNLKAGTAVTATGGSFTASFPNQTVTTFVCK
jgi:O-glycosyl hydrolase